MRESDILRYSALIAFLLDTFLVALSNSSEECRYSSFYIEEKSVVEGNTLESWSTAVLDECVRRCKNNPLCGGANFLLGLEGEPLCLLMDTTKSGMASTTPTANAVMYAARRYCTSADRSDDKLESGLCVNDPSWHFRKFRHHNVKNRSFILESKEGLKLDQCLTLCLKRDGCASALYSKKRKECRLSRVSPQNINTFRQYFKHDDDFDVFESNCAKAPYDSTQCNFLRVNHAGFVDKFDARLDDIPDKSHCEEKCLDAMRFTSSSKPYLSGVCRSYVYDSQDKRCYLSHLSPRAFGKNVLENMDERLVTGDLDNCMQFKLNCKPRSLTLTAKSMKLFRGSVRVKRNKATICEKKVNESYAFETEFNFAECSLDKKAHPSTSYSGVLMVKEGSTDLITVHDKMIHVNCRLHQQVGQLDKGFGQLLNVRFHVQQDNSSNLNLNDIPTPGALHSTTFATLTTTGQTTTAAPQPKFRLEVVDKSGKLANTVDVNDSGYLQITFDRGSDNAAQGSGISDKFFRVSELYAESSANPSKKTRVELIDEDGCISNPTIVQSLERISPTQLRIGIRFGGFADQAKVTYQALVKPCVYSCYAECNRKYFVGLSEQDFQNDSPNVEKTRSVRAIGGTEASRNMELTEDLYHLRSRETVLGKGQMAPEKGFGSSKIEWLSSERVRDFKVLREPVPADYWRCLSDGNCLFTVVLMAIQLILFLIGLTFVYMYIKYWLRHYRLSRTYTPTLNKVRTEAEIGDESASREVQNKARSKE
ncbi:PAN domain-containing protein [Ditylenchus destructor]|nr:PAN domain-containing protein [Ditylenchus destructor]